MASTAACMAGARRRRRSGRRCCGRILWTRDDKSNGKDSSQNETWKSRHSMTWRPHGIPSYVTVVILSHHREFLEFRARVRDGRVDMIQPSLGIYKLFRSTNEYI